MRNLTGKVAILAATIAASAMTANARSLLYYYDFDKVERKRPRVHGGR